MFKNAQYIVTVGTPDLIGGVFYGPFESVTSATQWAQIRFPATSESGRMWYVSILLSPESL
jgi:hypothetical protein